MVDAAKRALLKWDDAHGTALATRYLKRGGTSGLCAGLQRHLDPVVEPIPELRVPGVAGSAQRNDIFGVQLRRDAESEEGARAASPRAWKPMQPRDTANGVAKKRRALRPAVRGRGRRRGYFLF